MTSAPTAFVTVYTDGSAINHGQPAKTRAGYGICYGLGNSNNLSAPLQGPDQSSARAEVQAIVVALQIALSGRYSIAIRSDAGTVIGVLNGRSTPSANILFGQPGNKNHWRHEKKRSLCYVGKD